MLKYSLEKKTFIFKTPSGTSRGVLTEKHAYFIQLWEEDKSSIFGLGECSIIPNLSPDFIDFDQYEKQINIFCAELCSNFSLSDLKNIDLFDFDFYQKMAQFPSILFGIECAVLDLINGGKARFFETNFTQGKAKIPINGLIWMGNESFLLEQVEEKIASGFSCIKLKIGALNFENEYKILENIRKDFSKEELILRVDANGAFSHQEALEKINRLANLEIHSIEQPIKAGNWTEMAKLCRETKLPLALDEELIGVYKTANKINLLKTINPQFIILKPSLHGGFSGCKEWIELAEKQQISWWMTSALESNVGLNAIAQFTSTFDNKLHQGLGTGSLYLENTASDLIVENGFLMKKS